MKKFKLYARLRENAEALAPVRELLQKTVRKAEPLSTRGRLATDRNRFNKLGRAYDDVLDLCDSYFQLLDSTDDLQTIARQSQTMYRQYSYHVERESARDEDYMHEAQKTSTWIYLIDEMIQDIASGKTPEEI